MFRTIYISIIILLLSGCGGGTSVEPTPLKTLYFIDAPVNGIDFKCGNRVGVTETKEINGTIRSGVLQCRKDTITFSLGTLVLGSIENYKDGQEIRPQDLAHVPQDHIENESVIKIALLIQSLNDNKNDENITITEKIKHKLNIYSLTNLSIAEIKELILKLEKTPISLNEVKKHLIRNSSISYEDSKPIITPFQVEISTSSPAGFTIGTIGINMGKSQLISLTLSGEGSDNFQLNNDGTLLLLKKINNEIEYKLEVRAENIYGIDKETITLNFKITDKIGVVQLDGMLSNATIKIIKLNQLTNKEELIFQEKTSNSGTFNTHASNLDDDTFYIFEATNGIEVDTNTTNKGALRLIAKGEWLKNANGMIHITSLSEMQYDYVIKYIKGVDSFDYNKIETILNETSRVLLAEDLTGDVNINIEDILGFNPIADKSKLYRTIKNNNFFQIVSNKIRDNNLTYVQDLFTSCIIKTFLNTDDFKVVGTFAYVYGDNYFYIYDIFNQKRVSEIYLPRESDEGSLFNLYTQLGLTNIPNIRNVSIFLDIKNNRVFLSNLDEKIVIIDISNLNSPYVTQTYNINTSQHIIGLYKNILFFNENFYVDTNIELINDIKLLNINNINHPITPNIPNLPYFKTVSNNKGYSYISNNCQEDSRLFIERYILTVNKGELKILISEKNILEEYTCNSGIYFDKNKNFYLTNENSLKIYQFLAEGAFLMSDIYINSASILNRYENTLFLYNLESIFFIDISNITEPYLYKTIPFNYTIDNLNFQKNIFTTKDSIIDINSYIPSVNYIDLSKINNININYSLNFEPFKRFSNQNP